MAFFIANFVYGDETAQKLVRLSVKQRRTLFEVLMQLRLRSIVSTCSTQIGHSFLMHMLSFKIETAELYDMPLTTIFYRTVNLRSAASLW